MLKALMLIVMAAAVFAQTEAPKPAPEPVKFYRLEFVVKEVEGGKTINSRSYSTMVEVPSGSNYQIRVSNKLPIQTGPGSGLPSFQFQDVGVSIDYGAAKEVQGQLALFVSAGVSTAVAPESPGAPPAIRANNWRSGVVLPLRKPTVLFTSDDLTTKRQMQLELTAIPIK